MVAHFFAKRPRVCRMLMVKAIGGTKEKSTPYLTIERTDFQMTWFWIIRHKLKTTECEHQYEARNLCSV